MCPRFEPGAGAEAPNSFLQCESFDAEHANSRAKYESSGAKHANAFVPFEMLRREARELARAVRVFRREACELLRAVRILRREVRELFRAVRAPDPQRPGSGRPAFRLPQELRRRRLRGHGERTPPTVGMAELTPGRMPKPGCSSMHPPIEPSLAMARRCRRDGPRRERIDCRACKIDDATRKTVYHPIVKCDLVGQQVSRVN